jgi:polar amino acid transport system substrate-binding protein
MLTEIVEKIFKKMGKEVELSFWSWKHGYEATKQGEFVATFPYLKNKDREEEFYFSKPLFNILLRGFTKNDSTIEYNQEKDLSGLMVCRPEGYSITKIKHLVDKDIIFLKRPKEMKNCFHMLKRGEVDIVLANEFEAKGIINNEFGTNIYFKFIEKSFGEGPLHLIFPKSSPENIHLLYEFDQLLDQMAKEGDLAKIIKRHLMYYQAILKDK